MSGDIYDNGDPNPEHETDLPRGQTCTCVDCVYPDIVGPIRADLARVSAERDEARERCARLETLQHEAGMHDACEEHSRKDVERAEAAESRLAEVEAGAGAMNEALRVRMEDLEHERHQVRCSFCHEAQSSFLSSPLRHLAHCPLSPDAGRALLDELRALRRVRDAADIYRTLQRSGYGTGDDHVVELALVAVSLDAALDDAKAVGK